MISSHLRDRFFQRYGHELTRDDLRELIRLAIGAPPLPDPVPERERVVVRWRGVSIRLVWNRARRYIFTFLPPEDRGLRIAASLPKRRRR